MSDHQYDTIEQFIEAEQFTVGSYPGSPADLVIHVGHLRAFLKEQGRRQYVYHETLRAKIAERKQLLVAMTSDPLSHRIDPVQGCRGCDAWDQAKAEVPA